MTEHWSVFPWNPGDNPCDKPGDYPSAYLMRALVGALVRALVRIRALTLVGMLAGQGFGYWVLGIGV